MNDDSKSLEDLFGESDASHDLDTEIMRERAAEMAERFIPIAMKVRNQYDEATQAKDSKYLEMETRTLEIRMPKTAWDGVELIEEMFRVFEEYKDNPNLPKDIVDAAERSELFYGDTPMSETLISQAALDNLMAFMQQMARTAIEQKIEAALNDPQKLAELIEQFGAGDPPNEN